MPLEKMNILVVTPYYPPDLGPSAPLLGMLCDDLVRHGHHVTVLCAVPHFPTGDVAKEYRYKLFFREVVNGVLVIRVRVPSGDRNNLFHRLMVFFTFQILSSMIGLFLRYDVAYITNPALETFLPFWVLSVLRRRPIVYGVFDLYPEVGIYLGIFRQPVLIKIIKWIEDYCLCRAAEIHALSRDFIDILHLRSGFKPRVFLLVPWVDTDFLCPLPRINDFSAEHGLSTSFVVMYSGNMGFSQNLEIVLNSAAGLPEISFVFVGDGAARAGLSEQALKKNLINVKFLPFQPREKLPQLLASADLAIISLEREVSRFSIPSKTFPLLSCGRPILAVVEAESGLGYLLKESGAGVCVQPGDENGLSMKIKELQANTEKLRQMGASGRAYAMHNCSRDIAAKNMINVLQGLIKVQS